MPMPKPKKTEEKQAYVSRCIVKITREDADRFPDRKQRAAICYSQWNEFAKKNGKELDRGGK